MKILIAIPMAVGLAFLTRSTARWAWYRTRYRCTCEGARSSLLFKRWNWQCFGVCISSNITIWALAGMLAILVVVPRIVVIVIGIFVNHYWNYMPYRIASSISPTIIFRGGCSCPGGLCSEGGGCSIKIWAAALSKLFYGLLVISMMRWFDLISWVPSQRTIAFLAVYATISLAITVRRTFIWHCEI